MDQTYKIIPEKIMRLSAQTAEELGESNNSFYHMLSISKQFKNAGMTPMFLLNTDTMDVICVTQETFGKKLN
jgi:hypothetical protein